jgi:hypothetical protein
MNPTDGYDDGFNGSAFGSADDITWKPQPVCWPRLDHDAAVDAWHGLDAWIRWCVRRYGLALFAMTRQRLQDWVARSGCRPDEHRD